MICFPCGQGEHKECANTYNRIGEKRVEGEETTTWCDCMHKSGVILQAKDCKHLRMDLTDDEPIICPTCGWKWEPNDSGTASN